MITSISYGSAIEAECKRYALPAPISQLTPFVGGDFLAISSNNAGPLPALHLLEVSRSVMGEGLTLRPIVRDVATPAMAVDAETTFGASMMASASRISTTSRAASAAEAPPGVSAATR